MQSEPFCQNTVKIYSENNLRSALLDISCMSVYFFNGNRRIIATERMNKSLVEALDLCRIWVYVGTFNESDFAA